MSDRALIGVIVIVSALIGCMATLAAVTMFT